MKTRVFNLIILDESGSMSCIERQALTGVNETLQTIRRAQEKYPEQEQYVTFVPFQTGSIKFVRDCEPIANVKDLEPKDYNPGTCTPLYDAIGTGIAKVNALVREGDTVLVTIITDGEENCSREYNLKMVKNLIEKLKKQEWTFTLIGTDDLDVEGMALSMGIRHNMSFGRNGEQASMMFKEENAQRMRYFSRVHASKMANPTSRILDDDEDFFTKSHV